MRYFWSTSTILGELDIIIIPISLIKQLLKYHRFGLELSCLINFFDIGSGSFYNTRTRRISSSHDTTRHDTIRYKYSTFYSSVSDSERD